MLSKKSLKILFDFKYQLRLEKERLSGITTPDINQKKLLAEITALEDAAKGSNDDDFDTCFKTLMPKFQEKIKESVEKKVDGGFLKSLKKQVTPNTGKKSDDDFEFNSQEPIPQAVRDFFKQPLTDAQFNAYQALENKERAPRTKSSFFDPVYDLMLMGLDYVRKIYDKTKWDWWYWPNLHYGDWSWKIAPFLLGKIITGVLLAVLGMTLMPAAMLYPVIGVMGVTALFVPKTNLEKALLVLFVAAVLVGLLFCPPISVGLIFGVTLAPTAAMFANAGVMMAIALAANGVTSAVEYLIEPKGDPDVDNLFFSNSISLPPAGKVTGHNAREFNKAHKEAKRGLDSFSKNLKHVMTTAHPHSEAQTSPSETHEEKSKGNSLEL